MKSFIYCLFFLLPFVGKAQQDTLYISNWKLADTLYGQLGQHINTGFLSNRVYHDSTQILAHQINDNQVGTADVFYELMYQLKLMALDSSTVPSRDEIYLNTQKIVGKYEFDEDRYVYPIGIADYKYNYINIESALNNNHIVLNNGRFSDNTSTPIAYSEHTCQLIAPLFDYFNNPDLSILFRQEDFNSNYRSVNDIVSISASQNGITTPLQFDQEYQVKLIDSIAQYINIRIQYSDSSTLEQVIKINMPELPKTRYETKVWSGCDYNDEYTNNSVDHKLKYCMKRGCGNGSNNAKKPFILVTGYRPPLIEQGFKTTWQYYDEEHNGLLSILQGVDYDVYIVKFNMHATPHSHGMIEAANLFIEFLTDLNNQNQYRYEENVISASSMSSDIVRLALMKMDKLHLNSNSYNHHHSRLLIHYDANLFGANIPLATQHQIYSGHLSPGFGTIGISPASFTTFLKTYLVNTMEQKVLKELVRYHAAATGAKDFINPVKTLDIVPTHDQKRQTFLNELDLYDPGDHFVALPNSVRNIAISLGKISGTNDVNPTNSLFKGEGGYWINHPNHIWRAGKYTTDYSEHFKRIQIDLNPFLFFTPTVTAQHKANVKHMLPIDNASGSYLGGVGNLLTMTTMAYFPEVHGVNAITDLFNGVNNPAFPLFSHKSVTTALAIHPSLYEPNGSYTVNPQDLGLMYKSYEDLNSSFPIQSDFYGYPNLGRPNDHFDVTPFEAIYVDDQIDWHIRLNNSSYVNELNDFILNEVEPWYLWLQNQDLGAQARSNYTYRAKRTARNGIVCGHLVTPSTDPGDYVVKPNAELILNAGEYIDLFPGTTFEEDSWVTLEIKNPYQCAGRPEQTSNENEDTSTTTEEMEALEITQTEQAQSEVRIFPNPGTGIINVASMKNKPIRSIEIYDLSGNLVLTQNQIDVARMELDTELQQGTYIVHVKLEGALIREKLIIL